MIHNDPRLYSGGSVVFNSQPSVNLYAQLLQKKQAREDALDDYEKNRMRRINDKGMRDQDREVLDKSVADTMSYYMANKDKIRKGNTPEAYNYEKMWRGTNDIVSESRDATAKSEAFNKLRQERLKMGRSTPEEWFQDYSAHELPIRSEGYKPLDIPKYMSQINPKYDQKKSMDLLKGVKLSDLPVRYENIKGQPDLRNEIHEKKLDAEGLASIRHIAETQYDNDDGFAAMVQQKANDPLQRGELESVFEKHFKTKPQSLPDYAIAQKLSEFQPSLVTSKAVSDWPYKNKVTYGQALNKIQLNASLQGKGGTNYEVKDLVLPDGTTDLTKPLQGINVNNTVTGKAFKSDLTKYNPKTKEVTYHDVVDGKDYTVPAQKFRQIINTVNTVQDLKVFDNLIQSIDKAYEPPKTSGVKNRPPLDAFIKKNK